MSRGVNKVILIGNLGQDPEIKYFPSGDAVANFSVATSESWTDKQSGEKKEKTEWHRIQIFGKLAEVCGQYLKKGDKVYLEGQLQTRKYEKNGEDRYVTEVKCHTMQMLGGKPADGSDGSQPQRTQAGQQREQRAQGQRNAASQQQAGFGGDAPFEDDDIPF